MTAKYMWLVIFGMTLVTAFTRAFFLLGGKHTVLPDRAQRALQCAPAAALAAVILPDILKTEQGFSLALSNHAFYAALAGLAWFLWRRTMLGTIIIGMLISIVLRLF